MIKMNFPAHNIHHLSLLLLTLSVLLVAACNTTHKPGVVQGILVSDQQTFRQAIKHAQPGDTIVLANGVWQDFEIVFRGMGTAEQPITLTAQTKGKVIISGASNLRLSGEYLVVSGLVFKNGQSPTGEVIAFRANSSTLANNSRVTQTVIDDFNKAERFETDIWVSLFGKNNRFDHNHLVNKKNRGVTLAVRLDSEASRDNHHRIDHNYFGPRPNLGSNGGETLRVGTSHFSLSDSSTVIENNVFDRCDGEVEIISIKSGANIIRNNLIFESKGAVVLRHGNNNVVEDNVFLGNGVDHTGGVRVINEGQIIRNNYFEGLTGHRFGGALVIMNGVPNSSINRYHQVNHARIENNTFIDSNNIQLAAGADAERSARIVDSMIANNVFYSSQARDIFTVYDDISGITFTNNIISGFDSRITAAGLVRRDVVLVKNAAGLSYPAGDNFEKLGARRDLSVMRFDQVGPDWYPKGARAPRFDTGASHSVKPGLNSIADAFAQADAGDVLVLEPGLYTVDKLLQLDRPMTVRARAGAERKVHIEYERGVLFELASGGSLKLVGLDISGARADDAAGNSLIRTSLYAMLDNYELVIDNTHIRNLDVNHSFNVFTAAKGTMADAITISNSHFSQITGHVLDLNKEVEDLGIYNAEYITITDSHFDQIQGSLANVYRGGTDESTFGPLFDLRNSQLNKVGKGSRNKTGAAIYLHGVQLTQIDTNQFIDSAPVIVEHTVGDPRTRIENNRFAGTPAPVISDDTAILRNNNIQ
jgi:poly(beta-D-mannuronate) lyase